MGKRSRSNSELSESQQPARRSRRLASQEPEVVQQLPTTTRKRDIKRAQKPAAKAVALPPPPTVLAEREPKTQESSLLASQEELPSAESEPQLTQLPEPSEPEGEAQSEAEAEAETEAEAEVGAEPQPEQDVVVVVAACETQSTSPSRTPPTQFEPDLTIVEEEHEDIIETLPIPATPTPLPAWRRYGGYFTSAVSRLSPFARRPSQPTLQTTSRPTSQSATPPPPPAPQPPHPSIEPTPQLASQSPPSPAQNALRATLNRAPSPIHSAPPASPMVHQPVAASVETPMYSAANGRKRAAEQEPLTASKRTKVAEPAWTSKPTPRSGTQRPKVVKNPQRRNRSVSRDITADPYAVPVPLPEKVEFIHLFKSPPPPKKPKRTAPSSEAEPARATAEAPTPQIMIDHAPTNPTTPILAKALPPSNSPAPFKAVAPVEASTSAQSVKSKVAIEKPATKTPAPVQPLKRKAPTELQATPAVAKTPFLMPSTNRPGTVTSLTPVTEATERSHLSLASDNTPAQPMYTPSHPPATAPARQPRSIAQARAARLAPQSAKRAGPYAWELAAAERERSRDAVSPFSPVPPPPWNTPLPTAASSVRPAKPREANADVRFAKLERLRKLEAELAQLREDEDIKEMEGHRMKRVKVDHLEYIPHNKPGDSAGTFRVPEYDSDDEIEVEESVPLRANIFDDDKDISRPGPTLPTGASHGAAVSASITISSAPGPVSVPAIPTSAAVTPKICKWNFPELGQRSGSPSPVFKANAKAKFEAGFAAWNERNSLIKV